MTVDSPSSRGYDRLARCYAALEWLMFGGELQRARVAHLQSIGSPENALVLGDGNGRLLAEFCARYPTCRVTSVDHSAEMLMQQRRRIQAIDASDRVEFVHADLASFDCQPESVDVLIAAFCLDCFSDHFLAEHFPRWLLSIRPGGKFAFVDFVESSDTEQPIRSAMKLRLMHAFFRLTTGLPNRRLPDWDAMLDRQDLQLIDSGNFGRGMISCRLYKI